MTNDELTNEVTSLKETLQQLLNRDRGEIVLHANGDTPDGCLPCDGTVYDMTVTGNSYLTALFAKIGNLYGGDGVTIFAVPELRGEFVRIWDGGPKGNRGADANRSIGSFQDWATSASRLQIQPAGGHNHGGNTGGESQNHSHPATASGSSAQGGPNTYDDGGSRGVNGTVSVTIGLNDRDHTHSISPFGDHLHSISGGDAETRPRNVALAAFIRY